MKKRHIVWALIFIVVGIVLGPFPIKSKTNGEVLNDNYKYVAIGDEVKGVATFSINSNINPSEVEAAIINNCPGTPGFVIWIFKKLCGA